MLKALAMVTIEALLCTLRIVDTTRRKLRQDYPAMHGNTSLAHAWRDAER